MLNPHSLNGPELVTVLAALGLVVNASLSLCMAWKKSARRPEAAPVPVPARRGAASMRRRQY
jgi:hypothetical protein